MTNMATAEQVIASSHHWSTGRASTAPQGLPTDLRPRGTDTRPGEEACPIVDADEAAVLAPSAQIKAVSLLCALIFSGAIWVGVIKLAFAVF